MNSIPKTVGGRKSGKYSKFEKWRKLFCKWAFSWSKPSCETKDEVEILKKMFYGVLETDVIMEQMGPFMHDSVTKWAKDLEIHLEHIVFWKRLSHPAFEETTNSSHEALFSSTKHGYAGVDGRMKMMKTVQHLDAQATLQSAKHNHKVAGSQHKYQPWSSCSDVTGSLTTHGSRVLDTQIVEGSKHYYVKFQEDESIFYVWRKEDVAATTKKSNTLDEDEVEADVASNDADVASDDVVPETHEEQEMLDIFVPRFHRVRTLGLSNGMLSCSCAFANRNLMPCRHQVAVFNEIGVQLSLNDLHIAWTKEFYQKAY